MVKVEMLRKWGAGRTNDTAGPKGCRYGRRHGPTKPYLMGGGEGKIVRAMGQQTFTFCSTLVGTGECGCRHKSPLLEQTG